MQPVVVMSVAEGVEKPLHDWVVGPFRFAWRLPAVDDDRNGGQHVRRIHRRVSSLPRYQSHTDSLNVITGADQDSVSAHKLSTTEDQDLVGRCKICDYRSASRPRFLRTCTPIGACLDASAGADARAARQNSHWWAACASTGSRLSSVWNPGLGTTKAQGSLPLRNGELPAISNAVGGIGTLPKLQPDE